MPVKAIYSAQQDVGKTIKSSKKRFTWKFQIDGTDYTIELFVSSLSGKKKVTLNGATKHDGSTFGSFQWSTVLKNNQCMIFEANDSYDLRINNQSFSHLYLIEKTKKNFEFEDGYKEQNNVEVANKPKSKSMRTTNALVSNQPQDEFGGFEGFDHGFDKYAPKGDDIAPQAQQQHSPQRMRPTQPPPRRESPPVENDGFSNFQNQFSKPAVAKPQQRAPQPKPQQNQGFTDFGNFGQPTTAKPGNDPFANFGGFSFDEPQKPKPNPFTNSQPNPTPPPPKPQENLLDFMDDGPPVQTAYQPPVGQAAYQQPVQQQPQQTKQIPQELLDIFDDPAPQPVQQVYQPPQPVYQPPPTQPQFGGNYNPYGNPVQQQPAQFMQPTYPQQPQPGYQPYQSPPQPTYQPYQQPAQTYAPPQRPPVDILAAYSQPAPPQPQPKSTPFDELF